MDITDLAEAYRQLVNAAEGITDSTPVTATERADVDWRLAHIALSDRILASAARDVLGGAESVLVDNQPAMDAHAIAGLIASTTHPQRIDAMRRNAAELMDLLELTGEGAGNTTVHLRIHDRDGRHVSDSRMTWSDLIGVRANQNIPGHAVRLAELAGRV
ncbi:hypothetical protein [Streptomyces sp. NPDC053048]|uniref:hypothetical protein n=1 Tax=Streptomyces sp. NPDC053048 TaxID=3365694 RepID=UPI0037CFB57A